MNDNRHECPAGWEEADLLAYVEGELEPGQLADLELHLPQCDKCAEVVRNLSQLVGLLKETPAAFHPSTQDLSDFLMSGKDANLTISLHLAQCAACAEDVEILREMQSISIQDAKRETLPAKLADEFRMLHEVSAESRPERSFISRLADLLDALLSVPVFALGTAAAAVLILALAVPIWRSYKEEMVQRRISKESISRQGRVQEGVRKYNGFQTPASEAPRESGTAVESREPSVAESKNDQSRALPEKAKAEKKTKKEDSGVGPPTSVSQEDRARQNNFPMDARRSEKKRAAQEEPADQTLPSISEGENSGPAAQGPKRARPSKPAAKQALQKAGGSLKAADKFKKAEKPMEGDVAPGIAPENIPRPEGAADSKFREKERQTPAQEASSASNQQSAQSGVRPAPAGQAEAGAVVRLFIVNKGVKDFDPGSYKPPRIPNYDLVIDQSASSVGPLAESLEGNVAATNIPKIEITLKADGGVSEISGRLYQPGKDVPKLLRVRNVAAKDVADEIDRIIRRLLANELRDQ
jgi:anti-sigma factor RsiW